MKPFCAIYSTFLQRAYDQIVHDVALQGLPVRFAIDRAGLVGADGATHAGAFDMSFLANLPGFTIMAAADEAELVSVLKGLEGQLTATLHMDQADEALAARVLPILERKAGRILANGWPTGVEVCHAMVHGGPFPATSDARTTSVGSMAIDRFLRPVSYQNLSAELLPPELTDAAFGDGAPRLIDGKLTL
jgi:hypothetical protein